MMSAEISIELDFKIHINLWKTRIIVNIIL